MLFALILITAATLAVRFMGGSRGAQGAMVVLGLAVVFVGLFALPPGNAVRISLGSREGWIGITAALIIIALYRALLARLRKTAQPDAAEDPDDFDPTRLTAPEIDRYARHIVLRELGGPGQKRLKAARVLVVGAGGLGSPVLLYLAAAGVGTIGVIDDDAVAGSNLQRQVLFRDDDIGKPKVFAAAEATVALNPFIRIRPYNRLLTEDIAAELFADYDLVLDGTDSFETRAVVNRAAWAAGVPLISGAIAQWEGQIALFDPTQDGPCYACLFPEAPAEGLAPQCAEAGVMGALPGIIGSIMAAEAIKFLTGAGSSLAGQVFIYDALHAQNRILAVEKRADCAVCGDQ
ncbi:MAG: HesA/MoeB/ThiF family protein [Pseudomonadota bacterium]